MVIAVIPSDQLLHTARVPQDLPDRRRQEGEARGRALGEATVTLRASYLRCGPLSKATSARIQLLPLEQLEFLGSCSISAGQPTTRPGWKGTRAEARAPLGLQFVRPSPAQKAHCNSGPSPLATRQHLRAASGVPLNAP